MLSITATELPRIMQCNGSLLMTDNPELSDGVELDTTARDEGIAAHWLSEKVIRRSDNVEAYDGLKAPNGIFITSDMVKHVSEYTNGVVRGDQFHETELETSIVGDNFEVNSRADHVSLHNNILYIDDFKYGYRLVEVQGNWMLIAHAIGFCIKYQIAPELVVLTIYQPRARHSDGPRREWSITYDRLINYYLASLQKTLSRPSNELVTGWSCRRCPALPVCPAASAAGFSAIEESALAFSETISNDELSSELNLLKAAESRLSDRRQALEQLATHRLKKGELIPGYAVEQGKGNTQWRKHVTHEMLTALTGKIASTAKLMTPPAFRRALKNEALADTLFGTLAERPNTGVRLKRIDVNKQAASILNSK